MEFYDGVLYLFGGTDKLDTGELLDSIFVLRSFFSEQGIASVLKECWKAEFVEGEADEGVALCSALGLKRRVDATEEQI